MKIRGDTRVIGIFGDPISHTLSPAMHNAAFEALSLDMVYAPFPVTAKDLKKAVDGIRGLGILGVNVTVPHKEKVVRLLDDVEERARVIGAVNTVVNRDGRLTGHNTDAQGYARSIREDAGFEPKDKRVVIAGAGGSSRAILYELLVLGAASVVVVNRTRDRAERLVEEYAGLFRSAEIKAAGLSELSSNAAGLFASADLLVNATSAGLMDKDELDLPLDRLPKHAIVSDIIYSPLETSLLKKAKFFGFKTHSGLGMLVHQGGVAFELWTGIAPPLDVMRASAIAAMKTPG
ncbi:MAG: shikimate dehydrogenase [Deltaproteobacteria bacterium]|nr:shikimate dehydrogenase [Deltaproteobacteria bacterium]